MTVIVRVHCSCEEDAMTPHHSCVNKCYRRGLRYTVLQTHPTTLLAAAVAVAAVAVIAAAVAAAVASPRPFTIQS